MRASTLRRGRAVACDAGGLFASGRMLVTRVGYPRAGGCLRRGRTSSCITSELSAGVRLFAPRAGPLVSCASPVLCRACSSLHSVPQLILLCAVKFFCECLRVFDTRHEARTCGVGVCLTRLGMFLRFPVWNVSDTGLIAWDFLGAEAFEPSFSPYPRDERRACVHGGAHALRFIRREEYEHV